MAKLLKLRRGTTSQHSSFTGAEGEVTVDTDKDTLVVHDGSTQGGFPVLRASGGSEAISTTGTLGSGNITISSNAPKIDFVDGNNNPDFRIDCNSGAMTFIDTTNSANRLIIQNDGTVDVQGNLDANGGLDVTGNITSTGSLLATSTTQGLGAQFRNTGNEYTSLGFDAARTAANNAIGIIEAKWNNNHKVASIYLQTGLDTSNKDDGRISFYTAASGGSQQVRLIIREDGTVDIPGNLNVDSGIDISGNITGNDLVTLTHNSDTKIKLVGNANSRINFFENSAERGYIGWDASADGYWIWNNQLSKGMLLNANPQWYDGSGYGTIWHSRNDGSGSGLDADTIDSLDSAAFVRSDTSDDISGNTYNFNGGANQKIILSGTNDPYIHFREQSTDKFYIQWSAGDGAGYIWNQEHNKGLRIDSVLRWYDSSGYGTVWHSRNDGAGSGLDADSVDGLEGGNLLRSDTADTAQGDITFTGGAGAVSIAAGSDIRLPVGAWTGNSGSTPKIQGHDSRLFICGGSGGITFREDGTDRFHITGDGHLEPETNNTYDIGSNSKRIRNIYTNDLNLSNEGSSNDVDGTWGDWTIQEGESDLFLKNNRSGKKYKFNLMEVS